MTDMSSKPKRRMPQTRRAWQGYIALLVALGVCLFLLVSVDAVVHFPDERGTPIFYTLLLLKQLPYEFYLWGVAILFLMGLLTVALFCRVIIFAPAFAFVLIWGVGGYSSLVLSADSTDFKLYQSISHANYVYRLFYTWDMTASEETIHTYTIVKCDSLGLICHYFSTPHRINTRLDGASAFDESGLLFVDEPDQPLKLRVGAEVYKIDDWSDRPW